MRRLREAITSIPVILVNLFLSSITRKDKKFMNCIHCMDGNTTPKQIYILTPYNIPNQ